MKRRRGGRRGSGDPSVTAAHLLTPRTPAQAPLRAVRARCGRSWIPLASLGVAEFQLAVGSKDQAPGSQLLCLQAPRRKCTWAHTCADSSGTGLRQRWHVSESVSAWRVGGLSSGRGGSGWETVRNSPGLGAGSILGNAVFESRVQRRRFPGLPPATVGTMTLWSCDNHLLVCECYHCKGTAASKGPRFSKTVLERLLIQAAPQLI